VRIVQIVMSLDDVGTDNIDMKEGLLDQFFHALDIRVSNCSMMC
jgi:hypothetical protein